MSKEAAKVSTPKLYQLMNELIAMGVVIEKKWDATYDGGQRWQLFIPAAAFHRRG